jgi:hypothetical protein
MPQGSPDGTPTWRPPADSQQFSGTLDAAEVDNLPGSAFAWSYFGVHVTENSWRDLMGSR